MVAYRHWNPDEERKRNERCYRFSIYCDAPVRVIGLLLNNHTLGTVLRYADAGSENHIRIVRLIRDFYVT